MSENQNQQNQEGGDKVAKKYAANFKKMVTVLQGKEELLLKPSKIRNNEVASIVEELFKEEGVAKRVALKAKIKEVMDASMKFNKEKRQAEEDLKKLITKKQEEMNKIFEETFKQIENVDSLHVEFMQAAGIEEEPADNKPKGNQV